MTLSDALGATSIIRNHSLNDTVYMLANNLYMLRFLSSIGAQNWYAEYFPKQLEQVCQKSWYDDMQLDCQAIKYNLVLIQSLIILHCNIYVHIHTIYITYCSVYNIDITNTIYFHVHINNILEYKYVFTQR